VLQFSHWNPTKRPPTAIKGEFPRHPFSVTGIQPTRPEAFHIAPLAAVPGSPTTSEWLP
jgi:hypothetical protein